METGGIYAILFYRAALKQFIRKGIVWLFIAMVAGVIPVVSLTTFFCTPLLTFHNINSVAGLQLFELEWYFSLSIV